MKRWSEVMVGNYLSSMSSLINQQISNYVPKENVPEVLFEAMNYSLTAGGKRIRPIIAMATYEAFGKKATDILPLAINIELLHTYSLIHDDLPAMDNDDFRRGKPTNHKVFGDAIAILAGDALLTHAIGNLAKYLKNFPELSLQDALQVIEEFASYSGAAGMVGGQVLDFLGDQQETTLEDLLYIHTHKTGDLLVFSFRLGAILAGATKEQLEQITRFGSKLGLAFQIQDDILDVIGDNEKLGKSVGSDLANQKVTYPFFKGLEQSIEEVRTLIYTAKMDIKDIGIETKNLYEIADFLVKRET